MTDIAIFIPSLSGGGAERVMVTLANAFSGHGYAVDLVLASAVGPYLGDVSDSVRIVDLDAGRVIKALLPLARYLSREKPVAMLSAMGHANVVAIMARMLTRVETRVVVSERTTISCAYQNSIGFVSKINFWLVRKLYPKASAISSVSKQSSRDLARYIGLPEAKVKTLHNPFDLSSIYEFSLKPVAHPWFFNDQIPIVLAAGRLTEAKDYPTLIHAFNVLRKKQKIRLLVLGEGELRDSLNLLCLELGMTADDVQFIGFQDNPYAYMARCSLFVLSSQWEGLPGVMIQAMACGAPVVSTNCMSGPDEILEGGRWGRLVPVGDVQALAKAMEEVLDLPREKLPDVRLRAQDFTQDKAVDAYLELLGFTKT